MIQKLGKTWFFQDLESLTRDQNIYHFSSCILHVNLILSCAEINFRLCFFIFSSCCEVIVVELQSGDADLDSSDPSYSPAQIKSYKEAQNTIATPYSAVVFSK